MPPRPPTPQGKKKAGRKNAAKRGKAGQTAVGASTGEEPEDTPEKSPPSKAAKATRKKTGRIASRKSGVHPNVHFAAAARGTRIGTIGATHGLSVHADAGKEAASETKPPAKPAKTAAPKPMFAKKAVDPSQLKAMQDVIKNRKAMLQKSAGQAATAMQAAGSAQMQQGGTVYKVVKVGGQITRRAPRPKVDSGQSDKPTKKKSPKKPEVDPEFQQLADFFGDMVDWSDHDDQATTAAPKKTAKKQGAKKSPMQDDPRSATRRVAGSVCRGSNLSDDSIRVAVTVQKWGCRRVLESTE